MRLTQLSPAALAALGVDHVEPAAPAGDQVGDHLGRVLQVGVDHDHRVAARVVEPGGDGDFLAEVAR